jgi:hypothetical protein
MKSKSDVAKSLIEVPSKRKGYGAAQTVDISQRKYKYGYNHVKDRRKQAGATGYNLEDDLVWRNYKEPLRPVKDGYGYYGTLAQTKDGSFVQCHLCGQLFGDLGKHAKHHGFTARGYKIEFGLPVNGGLVSENLRQKLSKAFTSFRENRPDIEEKRAKAQKLYTDRLKLGLKKYKAEVSTSSLEKQNKAGNCPDQIVDWFKKLEQKYNRIPSVAEFERESGISCERVKTAFGSWASAVAVAGFQPRVSSHDPNFKWKISKEMMLAGMRNFYAINGWSPTSGDFERGLLPGEYRHIKHYFGSLYEARRQAGVPQLGRRPNGAIMKPVKGGKAWKPTALIPGTQDFSDFNNPVLNPFIAQDEKGLAA